MSRYLLEQLQAVRVVVIREEHHPGVPPAPVLPEPRESHIPLFGGAWHPGALEPAGSEHMQVRERHAAPGQEARHQVRARRGVLHHDPVEPGHLPEGVCQPGQLRFLHRTGVSRSDGVDDRQLGLIVGDTDPRRAGPGRPLRPAGPSGRRSPDRPFTVDIDHDDDNEDPGQKDEEAAEEHWFHGEAEVPVRPLSLTPSQTDPNERPTPTSASSKPADVILHNQTTQSRTRSPSQNSVEHRTFRCVPVPPGPSPPSPPPPPPPSLLWDGTWAHSSSGALSHNLT